jgi:uncharacterized damage-inducible protein DinB
MTIAQTLLPEFDQESVITRKTLDRLPNGKFDYAPHEKSMTLGKLANHIAEIPTWIGFTVHLDMLDMAPVGGPAYQPTNLQSREEILACFDKNIVKARAVLAGASDETLLANWSLASGGQVLFTMPRIACIRTWVMNHSVHHRAQLGVYLRLNSIPIPSVYGPSADDQSM